MSRTTSISCTIGKTLNTGNYSSRRVEWSETVSITTDNDDDYVNESIELHNRVQSMVNTLAGDE